MALSAFCHRILSNQEETINSRRTFQKLCHRRRSPIAFDASRPSGRDDRPCERDRGDSRLGHSP